MGSKYKEGKRKASKAQEQAAEKKAPSFQFPSNVRQIGGINKGIKIYIEDYAYTYINKLGSKSGGEEAAVFLAGYVASELGEQILVISGAIKPPFVHTQDSEDVFSEKDWRYAEDAIDKYFAGMEIVGWARLQPGYGLYLSASDISCHYKHFSRKYSVLFLIDPEEKLNCFFSWNEKQDDLSEAAGYFVYYDKNHEMNSYIADIRRMEERGESGTELEYDDALYAGTLDGTEAPDISEPGGDEEETAHTLSRSIENAKRLAEIQRQKRIISMMTSVSVLLFFACLIMGVGLLQNGERISQMENSMRELRTGYNNIVSKLNDSVFPAFAAQSTSNSQREAAAQDTSPTAEVTLAKPENEHETASLDEALGVNVAAPEAAQEPEPPATEEYVVRQGDTLTSISNKFYGEPNNISKIMEANGLTDPHKLIAGSTLIIPMD